MTRDKERKGFERGGNRNEKREEEGIEQEVWNNGIIGPRKNSGHRKVEEKIRWKTNG